MVKLTSILLRVPVIKFRKGGLSHSGGAPAAPAVSAAPAAAATSPASCAFQSAGAARMSTGAISDIDLPARYRRQPLSQEEIDKINGGGIIKISKIEQEIDKKLNTKMVKIVSKPLATIEIPRGVLIQAGKKKKLVSLVVNFKKPEPAKSSTAPKCEKGC